MILKRLLLVAVMLLSCTYSFAQAQNTLSYLGLKGKVTKVTEYQYFMDGKQEQPWEMIITNFDLTGNQTERKQCNMEGTRCTTYRYKYDRAGRITESNCYNLDSFFSSKYTYRYTADSTYVTVFNEDGIDEENSYAYDNKIDFPALAEVAAPGTPTLSSKYTRYDNAGNWLEENIYQDSTLTGINKRVIIYQK